jgi:hypothetical protein
MAWQVIKKKGFVIGKETITLPTGAATTVFSSAIDFLPPYAPFAFWGNAGAVDCANALAADLYGSVTKDGSYTPYVYGAIATLDNARGLKKMRFKRVNDFSSAPAPFWKIALRSAGNQTGEEIVCYIIADVTPEESHGW